MHMQNSINVSAAVHDLFGNKTSKRNFVTMPKTILSSLPQTVINCK